MTSDQPSSQQLRRAAEARLAERPAMTTSWDVDELVHELQVHQIQLEMQNENLRQVQFELEQSRSRYMDFYDMAPVGYLTLQEDGQIIEINLTGAAMLGEVRSRLLYHRLNPYIATEYQDHWQRYFMTVLSGDETLPCELAIQKHEGSRTFAHLECQRLSKGHDVTEVRIVMTDITERIKREDEIRKLAFYDALTQLPNRRLLGDRLDHAMAASRRSGRYGALMFVDLDNFKPLNDLHGHAMGDLLLIEASRRITRCLRETDTVARFGGDEFVVLLSELDVDKLDSIGQAGLVAEKIRAAIAEPYRFNTQDAGTVEHRCTSSIGISLFLNHESSSEDTLRWSDRAMYRAKEEGRNRVCFYETV